jgi:hypothetical protein
VLPGEQECEKLGLKLRQKIDTEGDPVQVTAAMDAAAALVKDGRGQCASGYKAYRIYIGVEQGDVLLKPSCGGAVSHVTYCECGDH